VDDFSVSATVEGSTVRAVVKGDVDLAAADRLWRAVTPLVMPGRDIVLDCSGIGFLDSSGLRILLDLDRRAEEVAGKLILAAVPAPVARVLDLAGVSAVFTIQGPAGDAGPS
jgi:anti-sigma B factor antagonist